MFDITYSLSAIEDETGDHEWLRIFHGQRQMGADMVPNRAIYAIKEPFYTPDKNQTSWYVRIDHPSDLVRLPVNHPLVPLAWRAEAMSISNRLHNRRFSVNPALDSKHEGNAAIKMRNFAKAERCYTTAIAALEDEDAALKQDLYRNRSYANLELGYYDSAIADALESIIPPTPGSSSIKPEAAKFNYKSYYRAGESNSRSNV